MSYIAEFESCEADKQRSRRDEQNAWHSIMPSKRARRSRASDDSRITTDFQPQFTSTVSKAQGNIGSILRTPMVKKNSQVAKTPARRISFQPDIVAGIEDSEAVEQIKGVCYTDWTAFRLSPLFGLKHTPQFLSRWAESLGSDIKSDLKLDEDISMSISVVQGLRGTHDDPEALNVEVRSADCRKCYYRALLLSVDSPDRLVTRAKGDAATMTSYPVMLSTGPREYDRVLCASLSKIFDCVSSRVVIQDELYWMAAIWVGLPNQQLEDEAPNDDEMEAIQERNSVLLSYVIPASVADNQLKKNIRTIDIRYSQAQLAQLWKIIHDSKESHATLEEIEAFHISLYEHVSETTQLQFNALDLRKVSLPIVNIEESGKLRIHASKHAKTVLRFLTELCCVGLDSPVPRIGSAAS